MPQLQRKVLAIPYIVRRGKKTRFLVVQDAESQEWTFISGTCEPNERPRVCVVRELYEETKGLISLRGLPKRTRVFRIILNNKRIDVFFIPLRITEEQMKTLPAEFLQIETHIHEYEENSQIRFETLAMFQRRKNIWPLIWDVMRSPAFHEDCPRL